MIISKTKEQLFHENISGSNVGVPSLEVVKNEELLKYNGEVIIHNEIDSKRPELHSWYHNNFESKDRKIKSIIKQINDCIINIRKTTDFLYKGHEAFGGGTMKKATFCFRLYKKEILNIILI